MALRYMVVCERQANCSPLDDPTRGAHRLEPTCASSLGQKPEADRKSCCKWGGGVQWRPRWAADSCHGEGREYDVTKGVPENRFQAKVRGATWPHRSTLLRPPTTDAWMALEVLSMRLGSVSRQRVGPLGSLARLGLEEYFHGSLRTHIHDLGQQTAATLA